MPPEPVLELFEATVVKDGRAVLDGLTLTIRTGEHTAIVGPNGAGKSVLVNLLAHQERAVARDASAAPGSPARHPRSGIPATPGPPALWTAPPTHDTPQVRVFGIDNWNVFELRAQLGLVSADLHHLFVVGNNEGRITAEAAVLSGFFASQGILRYSVITDEMHRRTSEALTRMGVSHLARRRLNEMSSGEARRVLLARALVSSPRALLLDEPTTGLDLVARHDFMERVRQIARDGTTLILVTHHIEEIIPEIEHVILLRGGRIAADGPKRSVLTADRLSELFEAPITLDENEGYYYARTGRK